MLRSGRRLVAFVLFLFVGVGTACSAPSIGTADSNFSADRAPAPGKKRESGKKADGDGAPRGDDEACRDDDECGGVGEICVRGACIAGCRDDDGCPGGQACMNRKCAAPNAIEEEDAPGCQGDAECPLGEICLSTQCVPGCHTEFDCPIGEICGGGGLCVVGQSQTGGGTGTGSAGSCTEDYECALDNICTANKCVLGCRSSGDCAATKTCVSGLCKQ